MADKEEEEPAVMESPARILMRTMRMAEDDCRLLLATVREEPGWWRARLPRMLEATRNAGRITGRLLGLFVKTLWGAASSAFDEARK